MVDITPYTGPVTVTVAYILLYYAFQLYQLQVKNRLRGEYAERGEKFDRYFGEDREMLAADRTQLNMLEHMPVFLALLWLHAVFVGTTSATLAGAVYVVSRSLYPVMAGGRRGRGVRAKIFFSTLPGYLVLAYFAGSLVMELFTAGA